MSEFAYSAVDPRLYEDFERQGREAGVDFGFMENFHEERGDTQIGMRRYTVGDDGVIRLERQFAVNTYPTYPGGGPQVTVDTAMQMPNIIARALTDLAYLRFVADRILARGTADQIKGGAAVFQRAESLFPDRGAEITGVRSQWPRTAWTVPDLFGAAVQKYGLETPIADETRRRNAIDELLRAQRKLANAVVKFIDATCMTLIITDPAVNAYSATNTWTGGTPNIIGDLAASRNLIVNADLGYEADTLIINPAQETALLTSSTIRDYLPRESTPRNSVVSGETVPILGLRQILVTNQIAAGKGIMVNADVVGSIADEPPLANEGYTTYDPGAGQAAIQVKQYRNEGVDETILRAARFVAMWIAEPKAAVYLQGL
jgi:hypothetical protein